ncbi:MAG: hypothetical protein U9N04_03930 [Patescibacteria group bacterium]|nr:hypothetical protein [Patescibacteria group bacterium]
MIFLSSINKNKSVLPVFLLTFLLFSLIQFSTTNLAGNDSHLYIKLAELTRDNGLIREFPWLNATIMKDNFTGLHFLYYILLIPFTLFGNLVFGAKIASLFFLSAMAVVFYAVLKNLKLKYNFFWFLFLLASSGYFLNRMNFARPLSFSVIFLLLIFYALVKRNNLLLFAISFFYVWAHGSFPLAIFLTLAFVAVNYIYNKKIYYKTILASLGGTILAVLINPFFPNNVSYFGIYYLNKTPYQLTAQIMEWQPISISQIFYDAPILLISFLILSAVFCVNFILGAINNNSKDEKLSFSNNSESKIMASFLFIISVVFFIGMLLQGRFIDYWVPFSIIFIAFYAELLVKTFDASWLYNQHLQSVIPTGASEVRASGVEKSVNATMLYSNLNYFKKIRFICSQIPRLLSSLGMTKAMKFILAIIIAFSIYSKTNFVLGECGTDESSKNIRETALWLKENTPEKSIVFNVNWGDFSKMFFYNAHNYYIAGLDGKFIYQLSPKKYWLYAHLGDGIVCDQEECGEENNNNLSIYEVLKNEFNADYVFVSLVYDDFDYTDLINILNSDSRFEKVYENEGGEVWEIK